MRPNLANQVYFALFVRNGAKSNENIIRQGVIRFTDFVFLRGRPEKKSCVSDLSERKTMRPGLEGYKHEHTHKFTDTGRPKRSSK